MFHYRDYGRRFAGATHNDIAYNQYQRIHFLDGLETNCVGKAAACGNEAINPRKWQQQVGCHTSPPPNCL
jgi:hypothetical protein